ncbi:polysaccharide biosynthesis C-terminal domain-containing protein [Nocardioides sp. HB32]
MSVVLTGGEGFLGWHLACRLRARHGMTPVRLGRGALDPAAFGTADTVFHLAGVSRAATSEEVEEGNVEVAQRTADAIRLASRPVRLVYANSIQADLDDPYGRGKRRAGELLAKAIDDVGGRYVDVRLPNLFGEHGRPSYNSFVATFADAVARGEVPTVTEDREVPLLHAQRAAATLIMAADGPDNTVRPAAESHTVSDVLARLQSYHALYAGRGEVPSLGDPFDVDLFNTYRSFVFPAAFPMRPDLHEDTRGRLFETVRSHGGTGQSFVSTTLPGATRGDHYHLHKVERFAVVSGEAEISLRRLYDTGVLRFRISGDAPAFVDMPTMWVHNITNVGDSELVTVFWADQLLDPHDPDQYPERVEVSAP